jgi:hypothetical protein
LIRASIHLRNKPFSKKMDHRVKPGDDDLDWCESGAAPGAASWLTGGSYCAENVGGLAPYPLKFDAY